MGLTVGGFALVILVILLLMGQVGRIGILVAVMVGALLPIASDLASGVQSTGQSVAPAFNTLSGGGR